MPSLDMLSLENIKDGLARLEKNGLKELSSSKNFEQLNSIKARYLGKKGELKAILSDLKDLLPEVRAEVGKLANQVKDKLEEKILEVESTLNKKDLKTKLKSAIDVSAPGRIISVGSRHPITETSEIIFSALERQGFVKAIGPEIEHDFYNFEALNIPKSHPARDMQDTFYVEDDVMLRTHTSPVQIRAMLLKKAPPIKIMSFGKVYRRDDDITHSPMFHQIEGLFVDTNVSLADLKGALESFARDVFSSESKIRLRPSFFPFTEPSIEVDVSCFSCDKTSFCRLCKSTGWIEVLGAGMVDPNVFESCGYDSEKYQGYAFGVGIERVAMLRYGITDIRLFFENDLRFLRQF